MENTSYNLLYHSENSALISPRCKMAQNFLSDRISYTLYPVGKPFYTLMTSRIKRKSKNLALMSRQHF